jgi:trehalose utilization protein
MAAEEIKVAVITGSHPYDVQGFHELFRSLPGIDAYIQHMDNFAATPDSIGLAKDNDFEPAKARASYDVLLFFSMISGEPTDEELRWYEGKPKSALANLGETGQGIFVLHHGVLQYSKWPVWDEIVGIVEGRTVDFKYSMDEKVRVEIANPDHPITKGMEPFEVVDETYMMPDADPGNEILLTTDNPSSTKTVGWTRQYKKSRVFCSPLGHDNLVWGHPSFRQLVQRAIAWCANRI